MKIESFFQKSQPQVLLEEIINYFVQAQEFYDGQKKYTKISVVPHGNRFFSWILQALSCMYLQQQEHTWYIIISTDGSIKQPITTNHKEWWTLRWRDFRIDHRFIEEELTKRCVIDNKKIKKSWALTNQLPFLWVSNPLPITPLLVPEKELKKRTKKLTKSLWSKNKGIIVVVNSLEHTEAKKSLEKDRAFIDEFNGKEEINRKKQEATFQLAYELIEHFEKESQLTWYINSSEWGKSEDNVLSYLSLIA